MTFLFLIALFSLALSSESFHIGPGQTYEDIDDFPWPDKIAPGVEVFIHHKSTPYDKRIILYQRGNEEDWIKITGVPNSNGDLPTISGWDQETPVLFKGYNEHCHECYGTFIITRQLNTIVRAAYIQISNLRFIDGNDHNNTNPGCDDSAGSHYSYHSRTAGFYAFGVEHLIVENCEFEFNSVGLKVVSGTSAQEISEDIVIRNCWFNNNGHIPASSYGTDIYVEADGVIIEGNTFNDNPTHAWKFVESYGINEVVRYNSFGFAYHEIDFRDPSDDTRRLIYSLREGFDGYVYLYGNTFKHVQIPGLIENPYHIMISFGGCDNVGSRRSTLLMYYNSWYIDIPYDRVSSLYLSYVEVAYASVMMRNNIIYQDRSSNPSDFYLFYQVYGSADIDYNWIINGFSDYTRYLDGTATIGTHNIISNEPGMTPSTFELHKNCNTTLSAVGNALDLSSIIPVNYHIKKQKSSSNSIHNRYDTTDMGARSFCPGNYFGSSCELFLCNEIGVTDPAVCNYGNGTCIDFNTCDDCTISYYGSDCNEKIISAMWTYEGNIKVKYEVHRKYLPSEMKRQSSSFPCTDIIKNDIGVASCLFIFEASTTTHLMISFATVANYPLLELHVSPVTSDELIPLTILAYDGMTFTRFITEYGAFFILGFVLIALVLLAIIAVIIGISCCINRKLEKTHRRISSVKNLDIILEEQLAEEKSMKENNCTFSINKALFEIKIDNIKLKKELGRGGSGATVFEASWKGLNVAVKIFDTSKFVTQKYYDVFEREIQVISSLSHPNILRFYGCCLRASKMGYVVELCERGHIKSYIEKCNGSLKLWEKLQLIIPVCDAMEYLHTRKIIHRDLKSENVLLTKDLTPKLIDFGLSKIIENSQKNFTRQIGTSHYMAPEVTMGNDYDEKCDVFSFAIIMYEILTENFFPYGNDLDFNIEVKVCTNPQYRPNCEGLSPVWLVELMKKNWEHEASDRNDFGEIKEIIEREVEKMKPKEEVKTAGEVEKKGEEGEKEEVNVEKEEVVVEKKEDEVKKKEDVVEKKEETIEKKEETIEKKEEVVEKKEKVIEKKEEEVEDKKE